MKAYYRTEKGNFLIKQRSSKESKTKDHVQVRKELLTELDNLNLGSRPKTVLKLLESYLLKNR